MYSNNNPLIPIKKQVKPLTNILYHHFINPINTPWHPKNYSLPRRNLLLPTLHNTNSSNSIYI